MLLDFRKAKNTRLAARVFLRFSQVSQHPACLDQSIQSPNTKTIRYLLIFLIVWKLLVILLWKIWPECWYPCTNSMKVRVMCGKFECREAIHYKAQTGTSYEKWNWPRPSRLWIEPTSSGLLDQLTTSVAKWQLIIYSIDNECKWQLYTIDNECKWQLYTIDNECKWQLYTIDNECKCQILQIPVIGGFASVGIPGHFLCIRLF